ncbi:TetR/AcrR family transcriptional regulator [Lipingzhangella sp. LS1_29]|uniref:TetR/AcrR family transcriptional regulator n=2 Tax=Lipingzhangella rawalii TaxID=2055835 RepID=A0ABU2H761_9ACTN|nr:TetR/AcrR family transcriptional regulator [Lipingzhangella rawalii]MDS1271133.1 TetR/AcrR family transcriptional regulator [Lipingzhangella rawalii]
MSKGERTRCRIMDSAIELFARSGYRAVSLRDISAHAGLTHAGVLHHFPNKDALLIAVLRRRDELDAPLVLDEQLTPRERLANVVAIVARNMRTPSLVSLYTKLSAEATDPDHPAHTHFAFRYQVLRDHLVPAFAELMAHTSASGAPTPVSPEVAAQQFLAVMDGLQVQWLLDPSAVDMALAVRSYLASLGIDTSELAAGAAAPATVHGTADDPASTTVRNATEPEGQP